VRVNPTDPGDPAAGLTGPREPLRGFGIGRIGGVQIVVAPSWVASVAVIVALGVPVIIQVVPTTGTGVAIVVSVILGVLLGVSVLAHELGHCLAARMLGMSVVGVRLYLLGGVSEMARAPRSPREEAVIASAGPAVSAVLAGVFWLALQAVDQGTVAWLLVLLLALSNLVVALFNLLPALPLDGGRVLRAGVWRASGNRRAGTTAAVIGGYLIAAALVGWAVLMVIDAGTSGLLPAGIAVAMGLFVAVGAGAERNGRAKAVWPAGVSVQSIARPVAQLPTETPVAQALDAAADRAVILTEADGVARGMLDVVAARELAGRDPRAPASLVARPWLPETIVLADDDPAEIAERTRTVNAAAFLLVDGAGQPAGVLRREDIIAVLTRRRTHWWERTSRPASRPAQSRKGPG
jgi:Zn-dependent protease